MVCAKSGECELQDLAEAFGIRDIGFAGQMSTARTYPRFHRARYGQVRNVPSLRNHVQRHSVLWRSVRC
ncbi:MAG: hypothetical protein R2864_15075 [Syntrophotaleaceae bacterium]